MNNKMSATLLFLGLLLPACILAETAEGTVQTRQLYKVGLPLNGVVKSVSVKVGAEVKKGDTLLSLDCRNYDLRQRLAKARSEAVEVQARKVQAELDRTTEMYDQDLIADVEMQEAQDRAAEIQARYREGEAQLQLAQLKQSFCRLHSPVDGTVVFLDTNPGDVVTGEYDSRPLLGIAGEGTVSVTLSLPASGRFVLGQQLSATAGGKNYRAMVSRINHLNSDKALVTLILPDGGDLANNQTISIEY